MKKFLLLFLMFCSVSVFAQTQKDYLTFSDMMNDPKVEAELFSDFDMKLFHDKKIMQEMMIRLYEMQQDPTLIEENTQMTRGIFNDKDSEILEASMKKGAFQYTPSDDLLKKASEQPFEAFKDFVKNARITKISDEEIKALNQVDKKAVSRMMQMMTESGPDVGAGQVGVIYNNEM